MGVILVNAAVSQLQTPEMIHFVLRRLLEELQTTQRQTLQPQGAGLPCELRCNKLRALKPCRQPPSTTAQEPATNRQPQKAQSSTPQEQAIKRLRLPGSVMKCPRLFGETSAQASNSTGTGQLEAYRVLIEQRTRQQTQTASGYSSGTLQQDPSGPSRSGRTSSQRTN